MDATCVSSKADKDNLITVPCSHRVDVHIVKMGDLTPRVVPQP